MSEKLKDRLIQSIELAEKVVQVRNNVKEALEDNYQTMVQPYIELIKDRMNESGFNAIKVVFSIIESGVFIANPEVLSLFFAAACEITVEENI
jgi:hypothetical protein